MSKLPISVTIIAFNEEKNISTAIQSVHEWVDEVLVIDSGSTDKTEEIAQSLGARIIHNPWKGYGQQKNVAQNMAQNNWILNIDADECVPESLREEIFTFFSNTKKDHYHAVHFPRKNFLGKHWIQHGGWYPNRCTRLYQRTLCSWTEPKLHETLKISGPIYALHEPLLHFSFIDLADQVQTNLKYAKLSAQEQTRSGSILRLIYKPFFKWVETYIFKFGFLDGFLGFAISINAAYSVFMRESFLIEEE